MSLKNTVRLGGPRISGLKHIYPEQLVTSYAELKAITGDPPIKIPPSFELGVLYAELQQIYIKNIPFENLSRKAKRYAPYVIFTYPKEDPGRLAAESEFCRNYTTWLMKKGKTSIIRSMLKVFLKEYPKNNDTFSNWMQSIKIIIKNRKDPGLAIWKERVDRFYLLDKDGPKRIGTWVHQESTSINNILEMVGFNNELSTQGFFPYAFEFCLVEHERIATEKQGLQSFRRIKELSIQYTDQSGHRSLRFWNLRGKLANALLLPFKSVDPADVYKDEIRNFLIDHLGDPRFATNYWPESAQSARSVMLRWLVEQTLKDFFSILEETADDIWKYRKDFWDAYLDAGYILEAWAVLGNNARYKARRIFKQNRAFGELKGASSNQSVLLMRIGNLLIAEWSHSGKCRIWNTDDPTYKLTQPDLYRQRKPYHANELRETCNVEESHYSSRTWRWQRYVANHIKRMANINFPGTIRYS